MKHLPQIKEVINCNPGITTLEVSNLLNEEPFEIGKSIAYLYQWRIIDHSGESGWILNLNNN